MTVPRDPLLVWVPPEAIYVEVKGTPGGEKDGETGGRLASTGLCPATSVGDWGLPTPGQLGEPVQTVLQSCSSREASEQGADHRVPSVIP